MDLSKVKWAVIILVVVGGAWLLTAPGTNYMFGKMKSYSPGQDAATNDANELSLSKLGGYLLETLRYEKAEEVLAFTVDRYPKGKNAAYNVYRLVKCHEKREDYAGAVDLLKLLMKNNAHQVDDRVPELNNLKLRANKLIETHNLGELIP